MPPPLLSVQIFFYDVIHLMNVSYDDIPPRIDKSNDWYQVNFYEYRVICFPDIIG